MPSAPLRPCPCSPTCPALLTAGQKRCTYGNQLHEQHRGSRIARGYDKDWLKLRAWFMQQPQHQLCVHCTKEGRTTLTAEVDHIVPFKGLNDPLRLDVKNLQGLCIYHHRRKHA